MWKEHLYSYWTKHGDVSKLKALDSVDWNVSNSTNYHFTQTDRAHRLP